ncbi:MAG: flagellar biosynthesis protein FlhF [Spirochaetales bacterium]|nr:flagellar biosynthesis protein FlhF [Spirochaetales bacterium]
MYSYFTEEADTIDELRFKIQSKYGANAKILSIKNESKKGFLGLFPKEMVVGEGYFSNSVSDQYSRTKSIEKEKEKILNNVQNDKLMKDILKNVNEIKSKLDSAPSEPVSAEKPIFKELEKLLIDNDFSYDYIKFIREKIESELPVGKLDDFSYVKSKVFEWISDSIRIVDPEQRSRLETGPRVIVLVGPTGVGKTTTIAKLAANFKLEGNSKKIKIITIDNYRIGAKRQMEIYGEIMEVPVAGVESADELRKQMLIDQGYDIILIDTIGKSPKDFRKLAEMQEILSGCPSKPELYLTIASGIKTADFLEIAAQFSPFKYDSIILTKLDETSRAGNVISAIHKLDCGISYITDGQDVPRDIEKSTKRKILINLIGFNE